MQAPRWCSHAVPTARGWTDPVTGEVFVARRFSQEEIDAFNGVDIVEEVQYNAPTMLHEAPVGHKSLDDMTKAELVALAESTGVEVSRYATKAVLIEALS